ncbi:MAG: response regulator [Bacteroidales bacterium]|nr:response regulator [Bacteroidales bacterium]
MTKSLYILWVDDEIDLLKPYFILLNNKGYTVKAVSNGTDALQILENENFDLVILDENMPGLSGLEVLSELKKINPHLPVIMMTKSEEENIMDSAIGSNISDYLIKPVNPNQLILAIKKIADKNRLITEKLRTDYLTEFNKLSQDIMLANSIDDWKLVYKKITYFEDLFQQVNEKELSETLESQHKEANLQFGKFIKSEYIHWFNQKVEKPLMSSNLLQKKFFPLISEYQKTILLLIDNLRYDHWYGMSRELYSLFNIETELYVSILPTATSYSRNALFSGLMPSEIEKIYPEIWLNDDEEGLKNQYEEELFNKQCMRLGIKESFFFKKIISNNDGKNFLNDLTNILQKYQRGVIIYNFIDVLSHSQTESKTVRELADNNSSYKSTVISWFERSPLLEIIKKLHSFGYTIFLTTDHGSIRVENPVKIIGEREITKNLRYKQGRNMKYPAKEVFEILQPSLVYLPKSTVAATYIFALNHDYFVYQNNYNQFVKYYKNTFQHGGISLDEMLIPYAILTPKE